MSLYLCYRVIIMPFVRVLLNIADAVVLLLFIVQIPRVVWKAQRRNSGALLLSIFVALFLIIFAMVSFTVFVGFFNNALAQVMWLVALVVMAILCCSSSVRRRPSEL